MSNWSSRRKLGEEGERENIWGDIAANFSEQSVDSKCPRNPKCDK